MGTHGPIEPQYQKDMKALAQLIDQFWNGPATGSDRKVGFCLLVFPFGQGTGDRINYMSNAERRDMLAALKELVARFEGHDHAVPDTKQ